MHVLNEYLLSISEVLDQFRALGEDREALLLAQDQDLVRVTRDPRVTIWDQSAVRKEAMQRQHGLPVMETLK